jgi:hypothetical protein
MFGNPGAEPVIWTLSTVGDCATAPDVAVSRMAVARQSAERQDARRWCRAMARYAYTRRPRAVNRRVGTFT